MPRGAWRLAKISPYYETTLGAAYHGDALRLIKLVPDNSVNLIVTSPPFALHRKKEYGNVAPEDYVSWFSPFADEFSRVLANDGSLVIHIGGTWKEGEPSKSLYPYKLLLSLCEEKRFRLAQDFYWHNPAKLPAPAEWVNVRRIRVKDTVEFVWWFSKIEFPKADNNKIKKPYSESMKVLLKEGYKAKLRPSGHNISTKFSRDHGGAIPPNIFSISYGEDPEASNLFTISNTDSNGRYLRLCRELKIKPHPARLGQFRRSLGASGSVLRFETNTLGGLCSDLVIKNLSASQNFNEARACSRNYFYSAWIMTLGPNHCRLFGWVLVQKLRQILWMKS